MASAGSNPCRGGIFHLKLDPALAIPFVRPEVASHMKRRAPGVQKALAHGAPVQSLPCAHCGQSMTSSTNGWIEPSTSHICSGCGEATKTRRKVFLNPLAEKQGY